jgi:hypothetical protein
LREAWFPDFPKRKPPGEVGYHQAAQNWGYWVSTLAYGFSKYQANPAMRSSPVDPGFDVEDRARVVLKRFGSLPGCEQRIAEEMPARFRRSSFT